MQVNVWTSYTQTIGHFAPHGQDPWHLGVHCPIPIYASHPCPVFTHECHVLNRYWRHRQENYEEDVIIHVVFIVGVCVFEFLAVWNVWGLVLVDHLSCLGYPMDGSWRSSFFADHWYVYLQNRFRLCWMCWMCWMFYKTVSVLFWICTWTHLGTGNERTKRMLTIITYTFPNLGQYTIGSEWPGVAHKLRAKINFRDRILFTISKRSIRTMLNIVSSWILIYEGGTHSHCHCHSADRAHN